MEGQSRRLESLDALRGLDMLLLLGLAGLFRELAPLLPAPFGPCLAAHMTHARWGACYVYDYIFPLFLFLTGVSWPFSYARQRERGRTTGQIHLKILWRMVALVLLGWIHGGILRFDWENQRLASVIGRIGIAWAVAAFAYMHLNVRRLLVLCVALLVGYWAILHFIPRPGVVIPAGQTPLSQGGYCICGWIDRNYLEICKPGKDGGSFATIGMPVTALFGALTGAWLRRSDVSGNRKTLLLLAAAVGMAAVAVLWMPWCPNVKSVWTPTYALVAGAISVALMAVFYWIVDVRNCRLWAQPLVVFGMNAITIYMLNRLVSFESISGLLFGGIAGLFDPQVGKVVLAFGKIVVMWLLLWYLKNKKIFLRV